MSKKHQDADVEFIAALSEIIAANDLAEIQVKRNYDDNSSLNVRVTRYAATTSVAMPTPGAFAPPVPMAPAPAAAVAAIMATPSSDDPSEHPGVITSPMVGTIYMQAEPGSQPFIGVGMSVVEGQTLMIIEAMKTMNQIPSPRSGTVKRVLVDDGSAVEYGTPLVILE
jgi:acetyl-CoA carboxylase biotin carboxyl carrier protein